VEPGFEPHSSTRASIGGIHFDHDISAGQYRVLAKDFHALRSMNLIDDSGEAQRLMGLTSLSANEHLTWLEDRVQYILHQDFDRDRSQPLNANVLAVNYGAALYKFRKPNLGLLGPYIVPIPGHAPVTVNSPRTGLIRLGPGLFSSSDPKIPQTESRLRLGTFFHEARHSDGNETSGSLVFSHAICPPGHSYAGQYACDANLNGPYTIGALFIKSALHGCGKSCSEYGKILMRIDIADSKSRIIYLPGVRELDPIHEGVR
jgi:hypothetical protein